MESIKLEFKMTAKTAGQFVYFLSVSLILLHFGRCNADQTVALPRKLAGVRFLITVNDTWADPPGCITTVATQMLLPKKKSESLMIGACDHGPIEYSILSPGKDNNTYTVSLTFHSSVIEDASPPACDISWNGTYLVPKVTESSWNGKADLLPSCFVMDSREGYHMTYYWFHILEWFFADQNDSIY